MYKNERELQMKLKDFLNSLGYIAVVDPLDYYDVIGVKCPKPLLEKRFNITGLNELACGFLGHATIKDVYIGVKEGFSLREISEKLNLSENSTRYRINSLLKCNLIEKNWKREVSDNKPIYKL